MNRMNTARRNHGCGLLETQSQQTIMVAGGQTRSDDYLPSVEKMVRSKLGGSWSTWIAIGSLPDRRYGAPLVPWRDGRLYMLPMSNEYYGTNIYSTRDGYTWRTENITMTNVRFGYMALPTENLCQ